MPIQQGTNHPPNHNLQIHKICHLQWSLPYCSLLSLSSSLQYSPFQQFYQVQLLQRWLDEWCKYGNIHQLHQLWMCGLYTSQKLYLNIQTSCEPLRLPLCIPIYDSGKCQNTSSPHAVRCLHRPRHVDLTAISLTIFEAMYCCVRKKTEIRLQSSYK